MQTDHLVAILPPCRQVLTKPHGWQHTHWSMTMLAPVRYAEAQFNGMPG